MDTVLALTGVLAALLIGAMSPGPSFLLVARTSLAGSRADGLWMAQGMGIGAVLFATLVLFGLQTVLARVPWLYFALQLAGGLYLIYLARAMWRGATSPVVFTPSAPAVSGRAIEPLLRGLLTQLSNPKTAVVYGSIFAALLPRDLPASARLMLPLLVFFIEAGWYSVVALLLSSRSPQSAYLRSKTRIDRIAGGGMGLLGVKLLVAARPTP
jgi:threonine/homoserine/homoserine lactone efflux protein